MREGADPTLLEQRQNLRRQLSTQRQLIAIQISHLTMPSHAEPRSVTMRFVKSRPVLAAFLFRSVARLVLGPSTYRHAASVVAVLSILRSG